MGLFTTCISPHFTLYTLTPKMNYFSFLVEGLWLLSTFDVPAWCLDISELLLDKKLVFPQWFAIIFYLPSNSIYISEESVDTVWLCINVSLLCSLTHAVSVDIINWKCWLLFICLRRSLARDTVLGNCSSVFTAHSGLFLMVGTVRASSTNKGSEMDQLCARILL